MGDPRKARKKYSTPSHPWQRTRIEEEKVLSREYGTKNRKEIWKHKSQLKDYQSNIKKLVADQRPQARKEVQSIIQKLVKFGIIKEGATTDDVLSLNIHAVMDRRLQALVFKRGLARSQKQARQFIIHEHIMVNGKKVKSPSHLIKVDEENLISFAPDSQIGSEDHPERIKPTEAKAIEEKKEKQAKKDEAREQRKNRKFDKSRRPARKPMADKTGKKE